MAFGWVSDPFGVLVYHEISRSPSKWTVDPEGFARQLGQLRDLGCHFVSMDQILARLRGGARLPRRALCLHFDDGRQGFLEHALPVLREHGAPATVYVVPGWLDGRVEVPPGERYAPLLSWGQLRAVAEDPLVEVGSHGDSHVNLKRTPLTRLRGEIAEPKRRIEDRLQREVVHFAPPYNRADWRVRLCVRLAGYGTLAAGGGGENGPLTGRFRIRRFLVSSSTTGERLSSLAASLGSG